MCLSIVSLEYNVALLVGSERVGVFHGNAQVYLMGEITSKNKLIFTDLFYANVHLHADSHINVSMRVI